jgi:hypothetical protein
MEVVYIIKAISNSDDPVYYIDSNLEKAKIKFKQAIDSGFYTEIRMEQCQLERNKCQLIDCYYDEPCY